MKEQSKEQLLAQTLQEYGSRAVPDDLNAWPAIQGKLPGADGSRDHLSASLAVAVDSDPLMQARSGVGATPNSIISERVQRGRDQPPPRSVRSGLSFPAALVLVLVLGLAAVITMSLASYNKQQVAGPTDARNSFVPLGKVRHVDITGTGVYTDTPSLANKKHYGGGGADSSTMEYWLASEGGRLLMREVDPLTAHLSMKSWYALLTNEGYFDYSDYPPPIEPGIGGTIARHPYSTDYIPAYTTGYASINLVPDPQIMDRVLSIPHAQVLEDTVLDGRHVALVEARGLPDYPTPVNVSIPYSTTTDLRFWVDRNTQRIMQAKSSVTITSGDQRGVQYGLMVKVTTDELVDRRTLPADFFVFKLPAGMSLLDQTMPKSMHWADPTATVGGKP
ncbi:MAG: hypothetical protein M3014_04645 [Chloroflexota bacterium]|nr:hypothetical protein [Chloroflexota bacterium]